MRQFDIGAATFGQFSGVYYIGYSLIHLPLGIMLDRFGPKKVMTLCILTSVIGLTPLLFAHHWIYPIIGRFLIGIGSSGAFLGVFKIIRMTFAEKQFPRMLSFSVMIGLIGAIYGGGPVSYMREVLGYQAVVQLFALGGVALALATYWLVPGVATTTSESSVLSDIKEVLGNKKVVLFCLLSGLMVGPLEGFADVWGTVFLKTVCGVDAPLAASMPSLIFIGMCFGAPVLSFIAEKIGNYLLAIACAGAIMALCFLSLLLGHFPAMAISVSFIIVGVCSAYQILAVYKASMYVREQVAGLATAMANMIIMVFGYAFHTIMGSVIHAKGGPTEKLALLAGMSVIPIALLLAVGGFIGFIMQERKVQTSC